MLKSRTTWPPGGWQFFEPSTGWRSPKGLTFDQTVSAIIKHRLANRQYKLATDSDVVAQQLDDFTCARLKNDKAWCVDSPPTGFTVPLPKRSLRAEAKESVAGGARYLSNASAGIKLWIDWFGEGKTVSQDVAERRAAICAECPLNDKKRKILDWFTATAAREIMAIFSALNDLNLKTSKDEQLKICMACDCPMKAKVWAPMPMIKKHLSQERFNALAANCWIRHEQSEKA